MYYVYHLQGESPNTCTKPSAFYSVVLYVGCVIGYKMYIFVEVLTVTETIFCSLVCMLKNLKNMSLKSFICSALIYVVS
jgi:hypothetical protein